MYGDAEESDGMVMLSGHHTPPASALSHAGAGPRGVAASAQSHARQLVYEEEKGDVGSGMAWRLQQQMAGHEAQLWQARQQQQVPQQQQQQQRGVAKGAVVRGGSDNKKLALQAQAASAKYKDETLDCENFMESAWRRPERAVVRAIPACVAAVAVASQCRRCRASLRRCRQPRRSRLASLEVCCCVVSRDALCPSAVGVRGVAKHHSVLGLSASAARFIVACRFCDLALLCTGDSTRAGVGDCSAPHSLPIVVCSV